jgi:tRNA(Ile)-lysidine synthase
VPAASPAADDAPLADDELDSLFAPLAGAGLIALGVSGGADSLALMDLVARWRGERRVVVLTVDHRLRKGSRAEAANVVRMARARGLEARILTWTGPRPTGDIEAAARAARYRLLFTACHDLGATHLAIAHHRDDLAETFLMRLKRGSGVFGLAAMRPVIAVGDVTMVRPLLTIPRSRLAATTAAAKLTPVVDPMNGDPRFDRSRMRRMLAAEGIDGAALASTAMRLAGAAEAVDEAAGTMLTDVDAYGIVWLAPAAFASAHSEVRLRALTRILLAVGGDDYPPRHDRLVGLADAMLACPARLKRTLAGTVVELRGGRFAFTRETGREGLPTVPVRRGATMVWDHRYSIAVTNEAPAGLSAGALSAIAPFPALRRRGKVVAAFAPKAKPLPAWAAIRPLMADRLSRPPLFPDFAALR